jgi:hypothetical protein
VLVHGKCLVIWINHAVDKEELEGKESKSESIKTPFQEQEKMLFSI